MSAQGTPHTISSMYTGAQLLYVLLHACKGGTHEAAGHHTAAGFPAADQAARSPARLWQLLCCSIQIAPESRPAILLQTPCIQSHGLLTYGWASTWNYIHPMLLLGRLVADASRQFCTYVAGVSIVLRHRREGEYRQRAFMSTAQVDLPLLQ